MLTRLDDTLWHQLPTTFDHVGTSDPRFFDRYWFAVYDPAGGAAMQFTIGLYNNMNVMDGGCVVVRGTTQYSLRTSRALRPDFEPGVGPMRVEVEQPMQRLRLVAERGEHPIALDVRWDAILPPEEERPHFERIRGRAAQDYQRFNQVGVADGWIEADNERIDVRRWWGARDHSWGVRPGIGISEPETGEPGERPAGSLFCFLFFSTDLHAGHVQLSERGGHEYLTGLIRERAAEHAADLHVARATLSLDVHPGTRRFSRASLTGALDDGRPLAIGLEPLGSTVAMPGLGYGGWNDGKGLGAYRGSLHTEWDTWDVSHAADVVREDGSSFRPPHRIAPVRVKRVHRRHNERGHRKSDPDRGGPSPEVWSGLSTGGRSVGDWRQSNSPRRYVGSETTTRRLNHSYRAPCLPATMPLQ